MPVPWLHTIPTPHKSLLHGRLARAINITGSLCLYGTFLVPLPNKSPGVPYPHLLNHYMRGCMRGRDATPDSLDSHRSGRTRAPCTRTWSRAIRYPVSLYSVNTVVRGSRFCASSLLLLPLSIQLNGIHLAASKTVSYVISISATYKKV